MVSLEVTPLGRLRLCALLAGALGWLAASASTAHADPPPGHPLALSRSTLGLFRLNYEQMKHIDHLDTYGYVVLQAYMRPLIPSIRERAPHLRIFMYFDASGAHDEPEHAHPSSLPYRQTLREHPSWIMRARGSDVTFWGGSLHLYDIGNPAYQRTWANRAVADALSGGFDGVFIDDVNFGEVARPGWSAIPPAYNTDLKWTLAMQSFLGTVSPILREHGLLEMPNVGIAWHSDMARAVKWGKIARGYFREHFLRWGDNGGTPVFKGKEWTRDTTLEGRVEATGVPFYAGSYGHSHGEENQMRYVRLSYLLFHRPVGGGFAWFAPQDPYNGAWTDNLGPPVSPATRTGAVWFRRFAKETIRVDTARGTAEIEVKPG